MAEVTDDSSEIEKLYEYGEKLNEAKDKSQNQKDYEGIIVAANGNVKAKQLAAQMIRKFFKYFSELSEKALDQHLYLCEEKELGVHVQAIRGLPLIYKDTSELVGKIIDILGQLLIAGNLTFDACSSSFCSKAVIKSAVETVVGVEMMGSTKDGRWLTSGANIQ